jgi:dienelactone hydrolase
MMKKFKHEILLILIMTMSVTMFSTSVQANSSAIVATGASVPIDACIPSSLKDKAVQFKTSDGILLSGLLLGEGSKGVTLGHANGWDVCSWLPMAEKLADHGYQVILWSYRNNKPSGEATGQAYSRADLDVLAASQVLTERGVTKIVSAGASIGGTSSAVAAPHIPQLAGLAILSSPRTFGTTAEISALEAIKNVRVPSFFAVSTKDPTGDYYSETEALYKASTSNQKEWIVIDEAYHGTDMLSDTLQGKQYGTGKIVDRTQGKQLYDKLWDFFLRTLGDPDQTNPNLALTDLDKIEQEPRFDEGNSALNESVPKNDEWLIFKWVGGILLVALVTIVGLFVIKYKSRRP